MPIPQPNKNEDKQKFVARCMGDEVMKKDYQDTKQRIAVCLSQTKKKTNSTLIDEVQENLEFITATYNDLWDEFLVEMEPDAIYDSETNEIIADTSEEEELVLQEAAKTTKKKKVKLNNPVRTPNGPKKFSVYVKNDKGNVVKVNFGDPNMEIKRDDPERRKSYRARHNCDNPGPKWKANYWSCKMWSRPNVSDLT
jgi:hypothetical protein